MESTYYEEKVTPGRHVSSTTLSFDTLKHSGSCSLGSCHLNQLGPSARIQWLVKRKPKAGNMVFRVTGNTG